LLQDNNLVEGRNKKQKKNKEEENPKAEKKDQRKCLDEPPTGYIHVRARRGQATDSHSLAERVHYSHFLWGPLVCYISKNVPLPVSLLLLISSCLILNVD
jgi:hypothetical protein